MSSFHWRPHSGWKRAVIHKHPWNSNVFAKSVCSVDKMWSEREGWSEKVTWCRFKAFTDFVKEYWGDFFIKFARDTDKSIIYDLQLLYTTKKRGISWHLKASTVLQTGCVFGCGVEWRGVLIGWRAESCRRPGVLCRWWGRVYGSTPWLSSSEWRLQAPSPCGWTLCRQTRKAVQGLKWMIIKM